MMDDRIVTTNDDLILVEKMGGVSRAKLLNE